jgi:DNA-binding beta-propeller fold protein YncE
MKNRKPKTGNRKPKTVPDGFSFPVCCFRFPVSRFFPVLVPARADWDEGERGTGTGPLASFVRPPTKSIPRRDDLGFPAFPFCVWPFALCLSLAVLSVASDTKAESFRASAAFASTEVQFSTGCAVPDLTRIASAGSYLAVSQPATHGVLLFDASGDTPLLLTLIEGFGQNAGQFDRPGGVAIDAGRGLLYVSDTNNHRLQVFQLSAAETALLPRFAKAIGRKGSGPGEFDRPGALALDGQGNLLVIDAGNHRVQIFDADLRFARAFGDAGDGDGEFRLPLSIAAAPDGGVIYVLDGQQRRLQAFGRDGEFRFSLGRARTAGVPPGSAGYFLSPFGVAVAPDGVVYVTDCGDHVVHRFDAQGRSLGTWGGFGAGNGQLNQPRQITIDSRGRLIVLDFVNRRGQLFSSDGAFVATFRLTRSALGMPQAPAVPSSQVR